MKKLYTGIACALLASGSFGQNVIYKNFDTMRIEIEALGIAINSNFDDYAPVITANGKELFFTSKRPFSDKERINNTASMENIYHSVYDEDTKSWGVAEAMPVNVNIPGKNNSNLAISSNGKQLLVYKDDRPGGGNIYESTFSAKGWTDPVSLGTAINSESHESSATFSPDGRTVYFVSERPGGSGKKDIWQATRYVNGSWSTPKNLGGVINSPEDEEAIFMHPDGKTMYFSSKGHRSTGGFDVYKSVYENDAWSKPVNLGEPINTPSDDLFFVLTADGTKGYYNSYREGEEKNIYEIRFISKETAKAKAKLNGVKGTVQSAKTQDPLEAKVEITDNSLGKVVTSVVTNEETGKYSVSLPSGKNYAITVTVPGYLFYSENLALEDTTKTEQLVKDISMQKLERGTKAVMKNIFFDRTTLKPESKSELMRIFQVLAQNPRLILEISGHTETAGDAAANMKVSEARAQAVADYLIGEGIPQDKMQVKGYGETMPIITDAEIDKLKTQKEIDRANAQNRRIEIKVISN